MTNEVKLTEKNWVYFLNILSPIFSLKVQTLFKIKLLVAATINAKTAEII